MKLASLVGRFLLVGVITAAALTLGNAALFLLYEFDPARSAGQVAASMAIFFGVSFPFVLIAGLIFGFPARAILIRNPDLGLPLFLVTGSMLGLVAGVVLLGLFLSSLAAALPSAVFGAFGGLVAAFAWWLLVERHRMAPPDA